MDRKSILIIAACFLVYVLIQVWSQKAFPPKPLPPSATNMMSVPATNVVIDAQGNAHVMVTNLPTVAQSAVAPAMTGVSAVSLDTNAPEQTLVITNLDARYTFTSHGGGLKLVELMQYPETVSRIRKKKEPIQRFATLNAASTLPTLAILGGAAIQGDDNFSLMAIPDGVRAEKVLPNGLRIVKEFQLTNNYLIHANVWLENVTTQTLQLPAQEWAVGTATPMNAQDAGSIATGSKASGMSANRFSVGTMWYDGTKADEKNDSWFGPGGGCTRGTDHTEFIGGSNNVAWAAAHNQFFALAVLPDVPAYQIILRKVNMPPPSEEELSNDIRTVTSPAGYATTLLYPAFTLTATQTVERTMVIYAGPKEYRTLARVADQFNNNFDAVMGFGKWVGIFSKALLLSMNGLHAALRLPYGWAIIVITIIIKAVFWPLTAASTRSMKRMQVLQPQMNALKEKYKDDPAKMNRKVMEFMKENKMNPMSGCWPIMIQMPVFFGFLYMLRSAIELRGAPFLWIGDLSQPDTLFMIPGLSFIPFISTPEGLPFNLLPLLMVTAQVWQAHLMPTSAGVDPSQQKIMRFLPLMMLLFMYNLSAGLALYWTSSTLLTVLQTKMTKNMTVDAPPSPLTPLAKRSK